MFKLKTPLFFSALALTLAIPLQTQAEFIKYKKYYIPIGGGDCGEKPIPPINRSTIDAAELSGDGLARIFITTDIGQGDPDDKQSLVHLLSFSNDYKILGLSTSGPAVGNISATQKLIIERYIQAYQSLSTKPGAADLSYLLTKNDGVTTGSLNQATPATTPLNDASRAIIRHARCTYHEDNGKPLYVLSWGSSTDVMKALDHAKDIRTVVRVISYSGHNNTSSQQAWFDHPNQADIWRVEYRGSHKPLKNCNLSDMDALSINPLARFNLVDKNGNIFGKGGIVFNGTGGYSEGNESGCGSQAYWTKLGDTVTTAFVMRSAAQRNNPAASGTYGSYDHKGGIYWELKPENYKGKSRIYSTWIAK